MNRRVFISVSAGLLAVLVSGLIISAQATTDISASSLMISKTGTCGATWKKIFDMSDSPIDFVDGKGAGFTPDTFTVSASHRQLEKLVNQGCSFRGLIELEERGDQSTLMSFDCVLARASRYGIDDFSCFSAQVSDAEELRNSSTTGLHVYYKQDGSTSFIIDYNFLHLNSLEKARVALFAKR